MVEKHNRKSQNAYKILMIKWRTYKVMGNQNNYAQRLNRKSEESKY